MENKTRVLYKAKQLNLKELPEHEFALIGINDLGGLDGKCENVRKGKTCNCKIRYEHIIYNKEFGELIVGSECIEKLSETNQKISSDVLALNKKLYKLEEDAKKIDFGKIDGYGNYFIKKAGHHIKVSEDKKYITSIGFKGDIATDSKHKTDFELFCLNSNREELSKNRNYRDIKYNFSIIKNHPILSKINRKTKSELDTKKLILIFISIHKALLEGKEHLVDMYLDYIKDM